MANYTKAYIGKGTKIENLDIVRVTLSIEELERFIYMYEGKKLITFELAALKEADKYGKTHTAYVSQREEETAIAETKPKRQRKPKAAK